MDKERDMTDRPTETERLGLGNGEAAADAVAVGRSVLFLHLCSFPILVRCPFSRLSSCRKNNRNPSPSPRREEKRKIDEEEEEGEEVK